MLFSFQLIPLCSPLRRTHASAASLVCFRRWQPVVRHGLGGFFQSHLSLSHRSFVSIQQPWHSRHAGRAAAMADRRLTQRTVRRFKRTTVREAVPMADGDLYTEVFQPFAVTADQFRLLMGAGTRYRAAKGVTVVEGGRPNDNIILVLHGEALAKITMSTLWNQGDLGKPVCRYSGKLDSGTRQEGEEQRKENVAPRGSTIGGAALVDEGIVGKPYPFKIIATTDIEWHEWNRTELLSMLGQPGMRAPQAAFYHLLYVELISTLHKEVKIRKEQASEKTESVERPRPNQLLNLSIFIAVPFFGFGFADNFIMIICGDAIDAHFGAVLGLTTFAAAGLGNWVSDVAGLGLGDMIERQCERMGLSNGGLTPAQEALSSAKWVKLFARIVGISLGCLAGMCPLLWLSPSKTEFREGDLEIYDSIFLHHGVQPEQFAELMRHSKKTNASAGALVIPGGTPRSKVMLVLRGELAAYIPDDRHDGEIDNRSAEYTYHGRLEPAPQKQDRKIPSRGAVVGGTVFGNPNVMQQPWPVDVKALSPVEYIEWEYKDLKALMDQEKAIQASFYNMLYSELLKTVIHDHKSTELRQYKDILFAVLADGQVDEKERLLVLEKKRKYNVSDQEHIEALAEFGWTVEGWYNGDMSGRARTIARVSTYNGHLSECVAQLQHASELIEEAMNGIIDSGSFQDNAHDASKE